MPPMADNYLEKQRADYELRKRQMLQQKRKRLSAKRQLTIERPEDEAL